MNKKGYFTVNVLTVAAVLLAVFGIIAGSMSFYHSSSQLLREHQMHLEDIARSVDQNTVNLFGQIREDLEYSAQNCLDDLQDSPIGEEDLIAGLMILDGDGTVKMLKGDAQEICLLGNEDGDSLCLCVDREDNSYLAFLAEDADGNTYGALIFAAPELHAEYTIYNTTGAKLTELYMYDEGSEVKGRNLAGEGIEDGASIVLTRDASKEESEAAVYVLEFKAEGMEEAQMFKTLHFEEAPISLLSVDAASGATPIAFAAPEE